MAINACGSSGGSEETKQLAFETKGAKTPPKVSAPPGPPPKELVAEVLKRGSGEAARPGDYLTVQYVGVNYKTGEQFEAHWQRNPWQFTLGAGEVRKGWELGLKRIRVGERRKLIVPSRLAYGTGALVYVIELLSIERRCEVLNLC
jgi:peptidylprolyl isomerase